MRAFEWLNFRDGALMTDNLELWNAVEKTPPSHTKKITGKAYQGTSPKPHYIIHKATETFGPCGIGWGFTIDQQITAGVGDDKLHIAHVKVWYKFKGERGEVEALGQTPLCGRRKSGDAYLDEDAPKKSVTDALIKALSLVGFAGDIFMGRYDDSKYFNDLIDEERAKPTARQAPIATVSSTEPLSDAYKMAINSISDHTTKAELRTWFITAKDGLRSVLSEQEYASFCALVRDAAALLPENDNIDGVS